MTVLLTTRNLRDLGGITTTDGRRVVTGRLFRSGQLADLDDRERAVVDGLALTTIIDLRRDDERERLPTPALGATTVHISPNKGTSEFAVAAAAIAEGRETDIDLDAFPRGYRQMAIDPYRIERYREVLTTTMTDNHQPVLFHCTAGKDRTGWTAALLLLLLGVARDAVTADYLRTNDIRTEHNAMVLRRHRTMLAERRSVDPDEITDDELAAITSLVEVRRDYLDNAFAAIDEQYGDFDRYRREALAIDDDTVERFRASVLV